MTSETAPGATGLGLLDGIRVVDFTQALSGPYATMMLADLGADVVKVEAPGRGDDARHWGPPFIGTDAAYFMSVNRNKRSAALDLKQPAGLAAARELIARADVMVENWRPGTATRLGLDPAALREQNPGLIVCSISGYGQDGNSRAGYDQIVQGTSGVMSLTGPDGRPTKWGVPAGDIAAGMFAATAIIAALYERRATGRGRDLDIAMQDSLIAMLTHQGARYLTTGELPPKDENGHSAIAPYGMFEASDGYLNICVGNDAQFQRMCEALDLAPLGRDQRFATNSQRLAHKDALLAELGTRLLQLTGAEAITRLERAGVPVGPVNDLAAVLNDPEVRRREMVVPIEREGHGRAEVVNGPWKVDGRSSVVYRQPPRLGEHTEEILAELLTRGDS
jgi:crotonobetainyl-CoA:carnitine CoA-transferase CaiB-like acyl-CoA transferase